MSSIRFSGPQYFTYEHGFQQAVAAPGTGAHTNGANGLNVDADGVVGANQLPHYKPHVAVPAATSAKTNEFGLMHENTYPTLLSGTNAPGGPPSWFKNESKVDVLICGAGPSGLEVAVSLLRQGVSFRIVDKAGGPLVSGRADGVQPRFLETLGLWGLATEVAEEGPLIERTAIWKDGRNLVFKNSHSSDSRYRGLHIITQHAIEGVYLRDLLRHRKVVERLTSVKDFTVDDDESAEYPVSATLVNQATGETEVVRAKHLVGADGASSTIRKQLDIKFDGISTDIYWGIMDAVYEGTYPHLGVFGSMINSEHGGCVMIPREDGMIRLYTQIDPARVVGKERLAEGGAMNIGSITPEEVLEQANRIFAPFTIKFASPLSWFAIWKISERVAERFSYKNRVHLLGDACHVHSVMGAFGLNASILDAANLAWKLGMTAQGRARVDILMPTYEHERRRHAVRIIETSGAYLRFVCASKAPVVALGGVGTEDREEGDDILPWREDPNIEDADKCFLAAFYAKNSAFLLGIDFEMAHNVLNPPRDPIRALALRNTAPTRATTVRWGVRAPNPRVTLDRQRTGYLYDLFGGAGRFNLVIFASDLQGPVVSGVRKLTKHLSSLRSFFARHGGEKMFKLVLVTSLTPMDLGDLLEASGESGEDIRTLCDHCALAFDDQLPGRDAHSVYGVDHAKGAVVVVRPDLWTGVSVILEEVDVLDEYFGRFLC